MNRNDMDRRILTGRLHSVHDMLNQPYAGLTHGGVMYWMHHRPLMVAIMALVPVLIAVWVLAAVLP